VHTFDIRFAKSQGLAGLFEAPANQLGWKGSGLLSIDGQGISIAVKRGLLTLFSRRSRRFPSDSLTEAYREGDALRLVFGNREQHEILSVWARGGEAAAEIVKLLPTLRTVELDHAPDAGRQYRFDWRMALLVLALAVVVAAGISLLLRQFGARFPVPGVASDGQSSVGTESPDNELAGTESGLERAGADQAGTSRVPVRRGGARPVAPSSAPHDDAGFQGELAHSRDGAVTEAAEGTSYAPLDSERSTSLSSGYGSAAQSMSPRDAAAMLLEVFEEQSARKIDDDGWWQFTVYIHTTPELQQQELWSIREAMLAVSRAWRAHDAEFAERLTDQVHMITR
jgi:hypothetical protein